MEEPGPFEVLDVDQVMASAEKPLEPLQLFDPEAAGFDAELRELEREVNELLGAAQEEWGPELEVAQADAVEALVFDDGQANEYELTGAVEAAEETDGLVVAASQVIPGEAYQDPPPYEMAQAPWWPPPVYIQLPGLPPVVLPPPPVVEKAPTIGIVNLTRPGALDFAVHDQWRVTIEYAPKSAAVSVHAWQDGVDRGTAQLGITGPDGVFVLYGSMGAEHLGTWHEEWMVVGLVVPLVLDFEVVPG